MDGLEIVTFYKLATQSDPSRPVSPCIGFIGC